MSRAYTTNGYLKVLAYLPSGVIRGIQINTKSDRAWWVVHVKDAGSKCVKGTYSVEEFGIEFTPCKEDRIWVAAHVPQRQTYGYITDREHALQRYDFHVRNQESFDEEQHAA